MPTTRDELREFLTRQLGRLPRMLVGRELKAVLDAAVELVAQDDAVCDELLRRIRERG